MNNRDTRLCQLSQAIAAQKQWMEARGGTMEAYVRRYGIKGMPDCYGDGGKAIWHADNNYLKKLTAEWLEATFNMEV